MGKTFEGNHGMTLDVTSSFDEDGELCFTMENSDGSGDWMYLSEEEVRKLIIHLENVLGGR